MEDTAPTPSTPVPPVPEAAPQPVLQQVADQVPIPEKKRFSKKMLILIGIIVVGIIAVLVLKKNAPSYHQTTKRSSDSAHALPTGNAQHGLNTYTNSESKFSIQYPEELQVKENPVGMGVSTVELRSEDNLDEDYVADIQMLTMPKYLAKAVGQDFDEYYNMSDNTSKTITVKEESRIITKVKNRTINGQRAFEFKSTDGSSDSDDVTIGVYIEIGDKIIIISTQEDYREELEDMLANFSYTP